MAQLRPTPSLSCLIESNLSFLVSFGNFKCVFEMLLEIGLLLCTFAPLSSQKAALLSHCDSQLQMLLNATAEFAFGTEQRAFTVFCQLPGNSVAHRSFNLSAEGFSDIFPNCAKICAGCPFESKPFAALSSDGHSLHLGCLNFDRLSLTVFSVALSYPSLAVLSLHRKPLRPPPPKVPNFRRFPSIDLRLPADFFFPFGCE